MDPDRNGDPNSTTSMDEDAVTTSSVYGKSIVTDGGHDGVDSHETNSDSDLETETDGGINSYTVRLELVDEPGELLRALEPIAENGGNLLGIHHERGNITPRGHIPVEVDLECPPARFDDVVSGLRQAGINVIQAGAEQYDEEISVVLVGHLVETDLSDTLSSIEREANAAVVDLSLAAPEGMDEESSARLRLAVGSGRTETALESIRSLGEKKDLCVVEPLLATGGEK